MCLLTLCLFGPTARGQPLGVPALPLFQRTTWNPSTGQAVPAAPKPTPTSGQLGVPDYLETRFPRTYPTELPLLPPPRQLKSADKPAKKVEEPKLTEEGKILLGAARNAVKKGDWQAAVERYDRFVQRFGLEHTGVAKEYAGVLTQAERLTEAARIYRRLVLEKPDDKELRLLFADVAIQMKDYPLAIELLVPVHRAEPRDRAIATKLARVYVFAERIPFALQIYERALADLRPDHDDLPTGFPSLLVDLDYPRAALPFLAALLKEAPKNFDLIVTSVRAFAKLEERERALQAISQMAGLPKSKGPMLQLGNALLDSEHFSLAQAVFASILQQDPNAPRAHIGMARTHMRLYQPEPAVRILKGLQPAGAHARSFLLARAEYHQLVGEYLDAKHIYLLLVQQNPEDHEARLALGSLYELPLRDWQKAKAEYKKIPPSASLFVTAQRQIGRTLTSERHFAQALTLLDGLARSAPGDGGTMAQLVQTMHKAGRGIDAVASARAFLDSNKSNRPGSRPVRLELGYVLLQMGKNLEARQEYEKVFALPGGRSPATYYGLLRIYEKLDDTENAQHVLGLVTSALGGDARNRLLLADLFTRDTLDHRAHEMIQAVLKWDPTNLAALIRLASIENYFARQSADIDNVVATTQAILKMSPTNVRALLDWTRALGVAQEYGESSKVYDKLLALDPDYFLPRREQARVLHSGKQFGAAQAAYHYTLHPSADDRLRTDLEMLAKQHPASGQVIHLYSRADLSADQCSSKLQQQLVGQDPKAALAVHRIYMDYQRRLEEQQLAKLEARIKHIDWKQYEDIPVAKTLLGLEPSNTSVWFDLSQLHGGLKQTQSAIASFSEDLAVDPREREALIGLERANIELGPRLKLNYDFFQQSGRDNLARIQTHELGAEVAIPYGDEDEYLLFGFARAHYVPENAPTLNGNLVTVGGQAKWHERWFLHGRFTLAAFENRLSDRIAFDTGLRYAWTDEVGFRTGLFLENVVQNGESLNQDIYRYGATAGVDLKMSRWWNATATYRYARYSDDNDMNELFARTEYFLDFAPTELKLVGTINLQGYREGTTLRSPILGDIRGATHPYFAPEFFGYYSARIEWKHWLSRDYFTYSNQCWYGLQYEIGWDNSLNDYHTLRALFEYDIRPWITVGADARVTLSPVYEAAQIGAFLRLGAPWCCR